MVCRSGNIIQLAESHYHITPYALRLTVVLSAGTILVTSATAAMRGNAGQHSHSAAMGGRRMLCQSLNAEFASKGIHVAHVIIDGPEPADCSPCLSPPPIGQRSQYVSAGLLTCVCY